MEPRTLVVMEGDQTGQELLEEALRVLDPAVTGFAIAVERHDLSLENRRRTKNGCVFEAAEACYLSPRYQEAVGIASGASERDLVIVEGV